VRVAQGCAGGVGVGETEARSGVGRPLRPPSARVVRLCRVLQPSLVLGSTQPIVDLDLAAVRRAGVAVSRRDSGGSAVLLLPSAQVWVDLYLAPHDPLILDDVAKSFLFVGALWQAALSEIGPCDPSHALDVPGAVEAVHAWHCSSIASAAPRAMVPAGVPAGARPAAVGTYRVYEGSFRRDDLSRKVCFAGLGPGEVTAGTAKVVGISQRRDRFGVAFHCLAYLEPVASQIVDLLDLDTATRAEARQALDRGVATIARPLAEIEASLLRHLPE